jgi:2'-5' RNA ligase
MDSIESALIIPAPEVEETVGDWRHRLDPAATLGVPAHITVLYPFAPPDRLTPAFRQRLEDLLKQVPGFTYRLSTIGWFEQQVLYLTPWPDTIFRELTNLLHKVFPEWPPYGGVHTDVVPHLTVGNGAPVEDLQSAASAVASALPIGAVADCVWLMVGGREPGSWRREHTYPLAYHRP